MITHREANPRGSPAMPSILQRILACKRERLLEVRRIRPLPDVRSAALAAQPPRDFAAALAAPGVRIIAELKRCSPSLGLIRPDFDPRSLARAYAAGGADACSVLTEEDFFAGRLEHIAEVRSQIDLPVLRKDFVFDAYQIYESRAAGADAVLLIACMLEPSQLAELAALACELQMATLVEVHEERDLEIACAWPHGIIGINNRDLNTFAVDLGVSIRLAASVPPGRLVVAESGIHGPLDIRRLQQSAGIHAFLVGEHLMAAADPTAALRALKGGAP